MSRGAYTRDAPALSRQVVVARTLVGQPELDSFLNVTGRHVARALGGSAMIGAMGGLHVTLLESRGTMPDFRRKRFSPQDVHRFSGDLQQRLSDEEGTQESIVVEVNKARPLKWYGSILAFNIVPNPRLRTERQYIEGFLSERFGQVPQLRKLDEHVAFGRFTSVGSDAYNRPELLLPEYAVIPRNLVLNGLMVFLNGVGEASGSTIPVRMGRIIDQQR